MCRATRGAHFRWLPTFSPNARVETLSLAPSVERAKATRLIVDRAKDARANLVVTAGTVRATGSSERDVGSFSPAPSVVALLLTFFACPPLVRARAGEHEAQLVNDARDSIDQSGRLVSCAHQSGNKIPGARSTKTGPAVQRDRR